MMYFFFSGRHFFFGTSVYNINVFSTKTFCTSGCVHSNVSAAYYGNVFAMFYRCIVFVSVRFHKIYSCKVFVCGIYSRKSLSVNTHERRKTCACSYKYGFEIHFKKLVNCKNFSYYHICFDFHTVGGKTVYLVLNNCFGKSEFGYAVYKYAACRMEGFEYCYLITCHSKVAGACKT